MRFSIKNLGPIKEADIEIGKLTLLFGENNTGKTYLTYAVWGQLVNPEMRCFKNSAHTEVVILEKKILEQLRINNKGTAVIPLAELIPHFQKIAEDIFSQNILANVLAGTPELFANSETRFNLSAEYIKSKLNGLLVRITGDTKQVDIDGDLVTVPNNIIIDKSYSSERSAEIDIKIAPHLLSYEGFFRFGLGLLIDMLFPAFLLTAQRDSIELFYKAIDKKNAHLLREFKSFFDATDIDNLPRFALPIEKNIDFARELPIHKTSFIYKEQPELIAEIEALLGVKFIYDANSNNHSIQAEGQNQPMPAHLASTSVRSLMHLHYWLKHAAKKGDLLMIDEPELSLHPKNQIRMARLFAKLVNIGIKVWITSHSDYIAKEINNLIMLGNVENLNQSLEKINLNLQPKDSYKANEVLKADDVRAYIAKKENNGQVSVEKVTIDKYGMLWSTFDEAISQITDVAQTLANDIIDSDGADSDNPN